MIQAFRPGHFLLLALGTATLVFGGAAQATTITMIDPPGATQSFATGINDDGSIVGYFFIDREERSFVRSADGTYTTFGPSLATAINEKGWVAGDLLPGRGYIRKPNGRLVKFGRSKAYHGFAAVAINDDNTVCGDFSDEQDLQHGFVRTRDGKFTVFDPSDSVRTTVMGLNDAGVSIGYFLTSSTGYGFMRAADGTITIFKDAPAIAPYSINERGVIVGQVGDYGNAKVFIRSGTGKIKSFEIPASDDVDQLDWVGINDKGVIAGSYEHDTGESSSGFVRGRDGTIATFDVPDAYFTYVTGLNGQGAIVGFVNGTDGYYHAYLRTP